MPRVWQAKPIVVPFVLLSLCGCQIHQTATEIRTDEQMLDVSYENEKARALFASIVHGTERETHVKARIGSRVVSLGSRSKTVAFNAHCNDHIRAMDRNADLVISQREATEYYQSLVDQGRLEPQE